MTVRRRNGVWYCDIHFQGTRYRRTSPINTKRGAEKHERDLLKRLHKGLPIDPIDDKPEGDAPAPPSVPAPPPTPRKELPTFADFAAEFMETYAKANNKPSEQEEKRSHLRGHLLPMFGNCRLDEIGTRLIEQFKATLLNGKRSRKRVNNILATLRRILSYAVEIELLDKSPKIKKLKVEDRNFKFLDFGPYEALVATSASDPLWHAAILLGGDAGLRLGEIRGIQPEHYSQRHQRITVQRSMWRDQETTTKGWSRRTIPLTPRLQSALARLAPSQRTYLVSNHETRPLTLEMTRWHLPRLCREAKIPPVGWHALRHTFCSHLAMVGAPPRTIQELAGHADLTTTLKYMHLVEGEKDRAIGLLEGRKDRLDPTLEDGSKNAAEDGSDPPSEGPKPSQDASQNRRKPDSET